MAVDLTTGDLVTVPLMPELGVGIVEFLVPPPFDRVVASFEIAGNPYREDFARGEVVKASAARAA